MTELKIMVTLTNDYNVDKLKKDLLKELLNYKSNTYKSLTEDEIKHLYDKLTNKLSIIDTF